jgi:hypothetical protein
MSTCDMNPFMNNIAHSIRPIVLAILNFPPWLCKKRKYIMLLDLILWLQQPGNDINTYFGSLVEDLKVLWYNHAV